MSDILDRAAALIRQPRGGDAATQLQADYVVGTIEELMAEIKRQKAHSSTVLSHCDHLKKSIETLKAEVKILQDQEQDLMKNCNALRTRAQKAEAQLQAIIYDEEAPEWAKDYHLLNSALDGPIIEAARKWHQAYRTAQNSNLVRKRQNEQQAAYVARLEAKYVDLMVWVVWDKTHTAGNARGHRIRAEKAAREALEKIRGEQE